MKGSGDRWFPARADSSPVLEISGRPLGDLRKDADPSIKIGLDQDRPCLAFAEWVEEEKFRLIEADNMKAKRSWDILRF